MLDPVKLLKFVEDNSKTLVKISILNLLKKYFSKKIRLLIK